MCHSTSHMLKVDWKILGFKVVVDLKICLPKQCRFSDGKHWVLVNQTYTHLAEHGLQELFERLIFEKGTQETKGKKKKKKARNIWWIYKENTLPRAENMFLSDSLMLWFHRLLRVLVFKTFTMSTLLIIYHLLSVCCSMAEQSSLSVLCAGLCYLHHMSAGVVWVYANIEFANTLLQILLSLGSSLIDCKKLLCFWEDVLHFSSHSCTFLFSCFWFKKTLLFSCLQKYWLQLVVAEVVLENFGISKKKHFHWPAQQKMAYNFFLSKSLLSQLKKAASMMLGT